MDKETEKELIKAINKIEKIVNETIQKTDYDTNFFKRMRLSDIQSNALTLRLNIDNYLKNYPNG